MTILDRLGTCALHRLAPETAHEVAMAALMLGFGSRSSRDVPALAVRAMGLRFPNPIGLGAGFDKDARAIRALGNLGFGAVEAGTVTLRPQPGQAQPRLFRLSEDRAVINRMGFNGGGIDRFCRRLARLHRPMPGVLLSAGRVRNAGRPVGANLGINKEGAEPLRDYAALVARVAPYVDYVTINLSSPNTPGLRDLQSAALLGEILAAVAARTPEHPPLLVKLAPDLADAALGPILEAAVVGGAAGLILTNTTLARPETLRSRNAGEAGGLSGRPLRERSRAMLRVAAALNQGRLALVSCGGIEDGADILDRIEMGADFVQVYTSFIYEGSALLPRLKAELLAAMRDRGYETVADARRKTPAAQY